MRHLSSEAKGRSLAAGVIVKIAFAYLALGIASQVPDEEMERQRGLFVTCCDMGENCRDEPAEVGCPAPPPEPTPRPAFNDGFAQQVVYELSAPISYFAENAGPFITKRGKVARALVDPAVTDVVIASVEGEEAFWAPVEGGWDIKTWCTLRVHRSYKGDVPAGGLLVAIFDGGAISQEIRSWSAHSPRCLPFDYGTFAFIDGLGIATPVDSGAVISMLDSGVEWRDHELTAVLDALAAELGGGQ